jgi:pimeloyl-ACP methyl ester carboxylesterase
VIARVKGVLDRLLDTHRMLRLSHDPRIAGNMGELAAAAAEGRPSDGFERYLRERPALGRCEVTRDWHEDDDGELRLDYASSLFAPGRLRLRRDAAGRGTLVFLHGSVGSAAEAFGERPGRSRARSLAEGTGLGLACWDWPLHGERLGGCLYGGLASPVSAEREYARLLPALGTSLWREWVAELSFVLGQLRRVNSSRRLHVLGSSMGAAFAYVAPSLGVEIASVVAINSCARVADLLAGGAGRAHGFFFYPLDALGYFDLEDLVDAALARGVPLLALHGDRDPGCLEATRRCLRARTGPDGSRVRIEVLPDHAHLFSDEIEVRAASFLRELEPLERVSPRGG